MTNITGTQDTRRERAQMEAAASFITAYDDNSVIHWPEMPPMRANRHERRRREALRRRRR